MIFYHHFSHYLFYRDNFSFFKDALPIIISSAALLVSVITPYLLIRYEKVFNANKQHQDFLRQAEIYLMDWLNITSYNSRLNQEFLETLKTPGTLFAKTFQFYDFPNTDFFKSYNTELINEFYIQTRILKDFNHNLRMIDAEFSAFKDTVMNGGKLAVNGYDFFREALSSLEERYPKTIEGLTDLRIRVRLLLKQANGVDSLKANKFFSFNLQGRFWYKKDMQFTGQELQAEKEVLRKEKEKGAKEL